MPRLCCCLLVLTFSGLLLNAVVGGEEFKTDTPARTPAEIERLIKKLGSDDFNEREKASRSLEDIGEPARTRF